VNGFVLGGTSSGVGKTVATLAVLRALADAGYDPQPAKAGPDFIDPSHHEAVADGHSRSLDPWLEGEDGTRRTYYRGDGDVCVVEGMMGLYDGSVCSTARVAEVLDVPVVLVVDASAGMQSVGATALGFKEYAAEMGVDVEVAGVLAQQAHGGRHESGIRDALPDGLDYVGRVPPDDGLSVPDRHLGLEMGTESPIGSDALDRAAAEIDTDRLLDLARDPPRPSEDAVGPSVAGSDDRPRVAVAADAAHCFCYPSTRERLREVADVVTFSPVAGEQLPDCDGVYLPGGYPELHAADLADSPTLDALGDRAADGLPVFGECGGLMTLAGSLTTTEGERFEMAGVLPADVTMEDRYQALDHVELRADGQTLTAGAGGTLRGHEFHYSAAEVASDATFAFSVERGDGITGEKEGLTEYQTLGTYAHVHPESGAFDTFVERL
jgi:cobyrinic acid a,c-diamide synthase